MSPAVPEKVKTPPEEVPGHFAEIQSFPATTSNNIDDDDYHFVLSLYPHFKKVPQSKKLLLRMKMEQVIYEALYGESSGTSEMS